MNEIKISPTTNAETYQDSWQAEDENGDLIDFTGATITFNVQDPKTSAAVLTATNDDGITIATTTFTVRFEVDQMTALVPKEYNVGCTILMNGYTTEFFRGTFPVLDGFMT